jgi:hypothetical protein
MPYRKFDTGTWNDPWFEGLSIKAKLGFIYFWTNPLCNQAGIYEISPKRILFELGYGIDTIYSEINIKMYWNQEKNIVWVKNFFRRQCQNNKFAIAALNSIKEDPYKLQLFISYNKELLKSYEIDLSAYHIDTISIPEPTETEAVTDTVTDTVTEKNKFFSLDSPEIQLSKLLYSLMLENNPKAKKPNFQSWAKHIDLLIRIDKRTQNEIEEVIKWSQRDSFWSQNILSTKKLRDKFDQLWLKMKGGNSNGSKRRPGKFTDPKDV